jgi:nicotinamidase-related amidase
LSRGDTGLLVVDMQEKLLRLIPGHERVIWNCRRLIDGAKILGIPMAATEQYPQGLGPTTAELASLLGGIPAKLAFSCGECAPIFEQWQQQGIFKILVCGIEAHVCVQQTVMDLLGEAYRVFIAVDALGSRHAIDYETAIRRMDSAGATITTTEAALFEWCDVAGTPEFKQIMLWCGESARIGQVFNLSPQHGRVENRPASRPLVFDTYTTSVSPGLRISS